MLLRWCPRCQINHMQQEKCPKSEKAWQKSIQQRKVEKYRQYGGNKLKEYRAILDKDSPWCFKCGTPQTDDNRLELHHIRGLAEGGTHDLANLALACAPCHEMITQQQAQRGSKRHRDIR